MTLKKYLLDQNIDQIEDDEEFCRAEYEAIRDYYNSHTLTEDDVQEIESRGYHKEDFLPYMEMNVGKLKEILKNLPDDMPVYVACQGYCNYNFDHEQPFEDTDTFGIVHDGKLFITDDCAVDIGNGETL